MAQCYSRTSSFCDFAKLTGTKTHKSASALSRFLSGWSGLLVCCRNGRVGRLHVLQWLAQLFGRYRQETLVLSSVTLSIMLILHCLYIFYICFVIWKDNLLPRTGRTRVISLYFLRLIMIFSVFWIPVIFISNSEKKKIVRNPLRHVVHGFDTGASVHGFYIAQTRCEPGRVGLSAVPPRKR